MRYLLTGIPGTGKTTIGKLLVNYGFVFIDSDTEPNLAYWADTKTGERAETSSKADARWYESHSWNLDVTKLEKLLAQYSGKGVDVVVCGMTTNIVDSVHLYDKVVLLKGDYDTIRQRLLNRISKPDPKSIETIFEWAESYETNAISAGAIQVDASTPAAQVVKAVTKVFDCSQAVS